MSEMPHESDVLNYFAKLSNWGRWGPNDQMGTLNSITPHDRVEAARLVVEGIAVSLATNLDVRDPDPLGLDSVLQRDMQLFVNVNEQLFARDAGREQARFMAHREFIGIVPHGSSTHVDAPSHIVWDGQMYNGVPESAVTTNDGATRLDITNMAGGVVGRGVLLDVAKAKGVSWLDPGEGIYPSDLEAAENQQGVRVRAGDILLIHTGHIRRTFEHSPHPEHHSPGLTPGCLPWLHERGIALLGSDSVNDRIPSGYSDPNLQLPVHAVALVAMGLWLIDNVALDELAQRCRELERWAFLFTLGPLRIVGATSSPVNPIAVL